MIISADRRCRNLGNCIIRPYLPALSTTGLRTNKDTSPVLANGVIPVIILLKSPIFHLRGIRENGKSGVTLHARLQMWCISSDVNSSRTRSTLGQPKISNLDRLATNQTRRERENVQPFITRPRFISIFFFYWRLARAHLSHSLGQDQSTVAQRAETTVAECSVTSRAQASFRIGSHTMPRKLCCYGNKLAALFERVILTSLI